MTSNTNQEPQTFAALFETTGRTFRIPEYQRAYAWGKTQIDQFLDDLREAQDTYYLGHYLFELPTAGKTGELLVIDGQQRLTTCVLFFTVLCRRLAEGATDELAAKSAEWQRLFLGGEATNYRPKLTVVAYDNHFFENLLAADEATLHRPEGQLDSNSQKLLRDALGAFAKAVQGADLSTLDRWGTLLATARVTSLVVTDKKEAAQLFAFQNDRGKSLTALETVKAYLMLQVLLFGKGADNPSRVLPLLEAEFARIYRRLTTIDLAEDDVLLYYWRSTLAHPYGADSVVTGVKNALANVPHNERSAWAQAFVKKLALAFEHVEQIERDERAQDVFALNSLALAYPLLLRAYRDGAGEATKKRLFLFLENITFRYKLRGGRADIQSRFDHCFFGDENPVLDDAGLNERLDNFVQRLQDSWWYAYWNDQEVYNALNGHFYQNPVDNYFLWRYERHLRARGGYPLPASYNQFIHQESIEHIAPQTPPATTDGNPTEAGYGVYHDATQLGEGIASGGWLHSLGNLMLLAQSQNSRVSNRPFAEKMADFSRDGLLKQHQLQDYLADHPQPQLWDKAAIARRHAHMLETAADIWGLHHLQRDVS